MAALWPTVQGSGIEVHRYWIVPAGVLMLVVETLHKSRNSVFTIRIPPDLGRVADVRDFVDQAGLSERLSPGRVFDLKVAVSEACANAIEHAYSDVQIFLWRLSQQAVVEVSNVGSFRRRQTTLPDREQNRGFGLRLMVSLADQVTIASRKRGKTIIKLTFDWDQF